MNQIIWQSALKTMRNSQMTLNAMFSHVEKLTDYLNEKWKQFDSKLKRLELKIKNLYLYLVLKILCFLLNKQKCDSNKGKFYKIRFN